MVEEEDVCSTWFEGMVNGDMDNADSPSTNDGVVGAPGAAVDVVPSLVETIDTVDTALISCFRVCGVLTTGGHVFLLKLIFIVAPEAGENRTRPNCLRSFPGVANAVLYLLFLTDFTESSVVVVDVALPRRLAEPRRFAWPTMRFLCPV